MPLLGLRSPISKIKAIKGELTQIKANQDEKIFMAFRSWSPSFRHFLPLPDVFGFYLKLPELALSWAHLDTVLYLQCTTIRWA